jgi:hypothetical protein
LGFQANIGHYHTIHFIMADKTANLDNVVDTDEELLESVAVDTVQASTKSTVKPYTTSTGWEVTPIGKEFQVAISSVRAVKTANGTRYVINSEYWFNQAPEAEHDFVVLQRVSLKKGTELRRNTNVVAYATKEAKLTREEGITLIKQQPEAYAQAIALFLK